MFGYTEMAERIHTGEVAMDLCRPYDYQGWWGAAAVGRASFYSWARGIPPFLAGALVFDLRLPDDCRGSGRRSSSRRCWRSGSASPTASSSS